MSMRILSSCKILKLYREYKPDESLPRNSEIFLLDSYFRGIQLETEYV